MPTSVNCEVCNKELSHVKFIGNLCYFQCCKTRYNIRKNTMLEGAHISLRKFVLLIYCFLLPHLTYDQVIIETTNTSDDDSEDDDSERYKKTSPSTVSKYYTMFRNIITDAMLAMGDRKIGGAGTTVEIDESIFGKRKYNRGSVKGRGMWVLGGVCRETGDVFLERCTNNRRDRPTLERIITTHVEKGTRIITDGWKAYAHLEELGYAWDWVNHSKNFVKPGTSDVHTEGIEGRWHCVKRFLPSSGCYRVEVYFPVYLWTIHHKKSKNCLFWELLDIIGQGIKINVDKIEEDAAVGENEAVGEDEATVEEEDVVMEKQVKVPRDKCPCVYCGERYGGLGGLKRHLHYCEKNPNAKKKKKNHVEMIIDSQEAASTNSVLPPCIFCGARFNSREKLVSHVNNCRP